MIFSFKEKYEDFIVQEELPFSLAGIGDFLYILFEKQGENTMEIINWIYKNCGFPKNALGIAGLKDKHGITKQWMSISKRNLKRIGGEQAFLKALEEKIKIVDKNWHTDPLFIGKNKGNMFHIRLRSKKEISPLQKEKLESRLKNNTFFPNTFGIQRFGKGNKNYKKILNHFSGKKTLSESYETKFKLQAYGSMRFNEYVMRRRENEDYLLEGDIMVNGWNAFGIHVASFFDNKLFHFDYRKEKEENLDTKFWEARHYLRESDFNAELWFPTGIVLGNELLVCKTNSPAREYDDLILSESEFFQHGFDMSKKYRLYGFRRPLRISPQNLQREREGEDIVLNFFLPTGAYASTFLSHLLKDIDPVGCIENNLVIPRPTL